MLVYFLYFENTVDCGDDNLKRKINCAEELLK